MGKKKTADVQFYAEVMDSVQTIEGGRRSMYDPDELEEEQRERDMLHKYDEEEEGAGLRIDESGQASNAEQAAKQAEIRARLAAGASAPLGMLRLLCH